MSVPPDTRLFPDPMKTPVLNPVPNPMKAWLDVALADLPADLKWRFESEYRDHVADAAPVSDIAALLGDPQQVNQDLLQLYLNEQTWSKLNDGNSGTLQIFVMTGFCLLTLQMGWPELNGDAPRAAQSWFAPWQMGLYGAVIALCVGSGLLPKSKRELLSPSLWAGYLLILSVDICLLQPLFNPRLPFHIAGIVFVLGLGLWGVVKECRTLTKVYPALNRTLRLIDPE